MYLAGLLDNTEDAIVAEQSQQNLQLVKVAMTQYATELVEDVQRATKVAFANAIARMGERPWKLLYTVISIVGFVLIIMLFVIGLENDVTRIRNDELP